MSGVSYAFIQIQMQVFYPNGLIGLLLKWIADFSIKSKP
ncbi:hypothetical protein BOVA115_2966 [Bacteroides ovatus]|nr:hypothetical protein BOVA115_2966 [Bacteroides ovatus]CAG9914858.1 hypothetical protein BOVAC16_2016 [Bacteroides ovatus]